MTTSRRTLLRTGLTVTAVGATGLAIPAAIAAARPSSSPAPALAPSISGTGAWGARGANGTIQVVGTRPSKIVVHHTATPNSTDFSQAHAFALSRDIQNHHMDNNGWIDTGQHFTNSRGGFITEGRHRSLEVLQSGDRHVVSAHTSGQNSVALGIENEGTYSGVDVTPSLWVSLVSLCAYMCSQYGISPNAIHGHRDFNSTECPGDVLYSRLGELRQAVGGSVQAAPSWPLVRPGDAGERVLAAQHLLRAQDYQVPTDGVYGPATIDAIRKLNTAYDVKIEPCYASSRADESALLGAGSWPVLVRGVHADDPSEVGKAARVLLTARGQAVASQEIDTATWKTLLS